MFTSLTYFRRGGTQFQFSRSYPASFEIRSIKLSQGLLDPHLANADLRRQREWGLTLSGRLERLRRLIEVPTRPLLIIDVYFSD